MTIDKMFSQMNSLIRSINAVLKARGVSDEYVIGLKSEFRKAADIRATKSYAVGEQVMADAITMTLYNDFGFGPVRQRRFHEALLKNRDELAALEKSDDDVFRAKVEALLEYACGKSYTPYKERYEVKIIYNGKPISADELIAAFTLF